MKFGLAMFPADFAMDPVDLGVLAERAGFESLFFPEHSHIPTSRLSHFASPGAELPPQYWHTHEVFVALAAAAARTTTLKLGTGLSLVAQRDPIWTAKSVATLDRLSRGRFLFGVGAGWNREEMENHGYRFTNRFGRMREHVLAMKAIWRDDVASFAGEHVSFESIWAWPKPYRTPHPPVLIGGAGPGVLDRVLEYGDEWLAEPAPGLADRIRDLLQRAAEQGRGSDVAVTVYGADPDGVDEWAAAGAHRCVFWLPPADAETVTAEVERLADRLGIGGS